MLHVSFYSHALLPSRPQRLRARNQVLQQLFGAHHGWLRERLQARLGCRHDAADMAAETFAQVVMPIPKASAEEPRALLTTIAKRLIFASWRRRDLERAYLEALAHNLDYEPSAEEQAQALDALLALKDRTLDGLSPMGRSAFLYNQLDGLTYAEIGRRTEGSPRRGVHQYVVRPWVCATWRWSVRERQSLAGAGGTSLREWMALQLGQHE
ncbi:sigma factor [Pseudomonas peli]|uniref:sigma factor n=1 Tax=Pseudomonas peli TaxID=592361 RepID=UPI0024AD5FE9|nr:sigma factor [Pseudomonas peli]